MDMSTKSYDKEAAHAWNTVLKKLDELKSSGETLEQIGKKLGVAKATTSRWLSRVQGGEKNSVGDMIRYAKKLGISPQEMFGESPAEPNLFDEEVAQELSENIQHSGLKVGQISIAVGISQCQLESILSGNICPSLQEFHSICDEIGINPTIVLNKAASKIKEESTDNQQTKKSA